MDELQTKLHSMWTPEMFDQFEADVRALLLMNSQLSEQEREGIVTALKEQAIRDTRPPRSPNPDTRSC